MFDITYAVQSWLGANGLEEGCYVQQLNLSSHHVRVFGTIELLDAVVRATSVSAMFFANRVPFQDRRGDYYLIIGWR